MNYLEEKIEILFQGEKDTLVSFFRKKYTRWQLISGSKLEPVDKIWRILSLYRMGYEAEVKSQWIKADFFFDKVFKLLKKAFNDTKSWEAVIKECGIKENIESLREKFVVNIFMAVHLGFCKGVVNKTPAHSGAKRAEIHLERFRYLLNTFSINDSIKKDITYDMRKFKLELYENLKDWHRAINVCKELVTAAADPGYFYCKLEGFYFNKALSKMLENDSRHNEYILSDAVEKLEELLEQLPGNISIYDHIGYLYYLLSINNANSGDYSAALLSIEKASVYNPSIENLEETRNQLMITVKDMQNKMKQVLKQINETPEASLTHEGRMMVEQFKAVYVSVNKYIESPEYELTKKKRHTAYLRDIWKRVNPPDVDDPDWKKKAEMLHSALVQLIDKEIPDDKILEEWTNILKDFPGLKEIPVNNIGNFVTGLKEPEKNEEDFTTFPFKSKLFLDSPGEGLQPARKGKQNKAVPFDFWFFSPKNLLVKFMGITAVILLLITGYFTVKEAIKDYSRNQAYDKIISAYNIKNTQDFAVLTGNIEGFLDNLPSFKQDSRENYIRSLYTRKFYRWFMGQNSSDEKILKKLINKYKKLMVGR